MNHGNLTCSCISFLEFISLEIKHITFLLLSADFSVHYSQHNYSQMTSFLQEQASKCPNIIKLTTIGTSQRGKLIYSLEITEDLGVAQKKPHIGLIGGLQGTDIVGKELLLKLVEYLCSAYAQKEASVTKLLHTTVLHIVPAVDVDGNEKATEGDCNGTLEAKDDLSRSFYYNLTQSEKSSLPENIEEVSVSECKANDNKMVLLNYMCIEFGHQCHSQEKIMTGAMSIIKFYLAIEGIQLLHIASVCLLLSTTLALVLSCQDCSITIFPSVQVNPSCSQNQSKISTSPHWPKVESQLINLKSRNSSA